jgi:hypothetical protein
METAEIWRGYGLRDISRSVSPDRPRKKFLYSSGGNRLVVHKRSTNLSECGQARLNVQADKENWVSWHLSRKRGELWEESTDDVNRTALNTMGALSVSYNTDTPLIYTSIIGRS